jgi:hypothetical protein
MPPNAPRNAPTQLEPLEPSSGKRPLKIKINDAWYDLTHWQQSHPGGAEILQHLNGEDATGQRRSVAQRSAAQPAVCPLVRCCTEHHGVAQMRSPRCTRRRPMLAWPSCPSAPRPARPTPRPSPRTSAPSASSSRRRACSSGAQPLRPVGVREQCKAEGRAARAVAGTGTSSTSAWSSS